jgi:hypothetical protein
MEYMRKLRQWLLTPFLVVVAVIVVVLEATLWRWLTALGQVLGRFAFFAQLERLVERLSPGAVVAVFALPFVPIIPLLKVGEIWLIRHHHFVWAAVAIVGAKVAGAAFSTRVFAIARPKMMQVRWFARFYTGMTWLLDRGHRALQGLPGWRMARTAVGRVRATARMAATALGGLLRVEDPAGGQGLLGRQFVAVVRRVRGE